MNENIYIWLFEIFQLAAIGLGVMVMFTLRSQNEKVRDVEKEQRELDRQLDREQRELDREQDRYLKQLERNLHDDRMSVYFEILQPFIFALSPNSIVSNKKEYGNSTPLEIAQQKILDLDYKQTSLKLSMVGSDEVVSAFANMMQHFYQAAAVRREVGLRGLSNNGVNARETIQEAQQISRENTLKVMYLLGQFLYAIRKSVGNESTEIGLREMLGWLITDIDDYIEELEAIRE